MGYGSYLGVLAHKHYHGRMWPGMFKTSWLKFLIRYLVMAAMAVPFGALFIFLPWTLNIAILVIFKTLIPLFGITFIIFAFSHYFFAKFNLLNVPKKDVLNQ
jgi:hypothetical protein